MEHEHHHHDHAEPGPDVDMFSPEFWDERYAGAERVWSGRPNARLVEQVADVAPGDALDVGCGEGADAVWLAERGWTVVAVDASQVALDRAAAHAGAAGERITWQQVDARSWAPPADAYDLVTAHFLHLPREAAEVLHRRLAAAVRPGGRLLLVGHHPSDVDAGVGRWNRPDLLCTPEQLAAAIDPAGWDVLVCDALPREERGHAVHDAVLHARRR
jgi:SAM-dependent methyltransferase